MTKESIMSPENKQSESVPMSNGTNRIGEHIPKTIESDVLFDKQLEKQKFIVSEIIPEGLVLLAAPPKAGKSFFVLSLCVAVAKGEPFLGFPTEKGRALYFCFEDDEKRLQKRLFEMSDEPFSGLTMCTEVIKLEDGKFIAYLKSHMEKYPDTKLIVVDTLNYIRSDNGNSNMYKTDYDDIIPLHLFSQQYNVTVLLVHHTRKLSGGDEFNAASGSTGLTGAVDSYMLLKRPKRNDGTAVLFISGRDIETIELNIVQSHNGVWQLDDENGYTEKGIRDEIKAVFLCLAWCYDLNSPLTVSATELSQKIGEIFSVFVPSNMITKYLTADHEDLEKLGLKFECKRTKTGRLLVFRKTDNFVKPPVMFDVDGKIDLQISECNGDGGDGVTAETHSDNNSLPAVNQIEVSAEEKSASEVSESIATADKNEYSVDVSEPPVTAESRCQNSCQPVNRNSNGGRKKKGNSKKNKKKGGKSKHGKKR